VPGRRDLMHKREGIEIVLSIVDIGALPVVEVPRLWLNLTNFHRQNNYERDISSKK
jgi:hypothetical protein